MSNGWQTKTLGDVAEVIAGQSPEGSFYNTSGDGLPFYQGKKEFGARFIGTATTWTTQITKIALEGDVLMSVRAPVGPVNCATEKSCIGRGLAAIRSGNGLNRNFLFYFLLSKQDEICGTEGAVFASMNKNDIQQIEIAVPAPSEQQRIVGILDEAFGGIATAKANAAKNLQNARALFESHLQAVLLSKKWKWKTLGDLCVGVEYGTSAKSKKEGKIAVLRMGNIQDGHLEWDNLVYSDEKDEIKKYLLKHNDVLFNRTNSPKLVGKTAIYKSQMPAIFAGYLIRIHRKEDLLDGDYLNYFLNSQIALAYGKTVVISSVNQANINGAKLKGYPIPAPSLSEQRIIVKKLDGLQEETKRLASLYQRKLAALEALKKSLLHQAFTGQL